MLNLSYNNDPKKLFIYNRYYKYSGTLILRRLLTDLFG